MWGSSTGRGIVLIFGFVAVGCASTYLGAWEHNDGSFYRRLVLDADGTCVVVSGTKGANYRDGIGARCRYSTAGDIISITEIGELGGTGSLETLPKSIQFKFESGRLAAVSGDREILVRVPK